MKKNISNDIDALSSSFEARKRDESNNNNNKNYELFKFLEN